MSNQTRDACVVVGMCCMGLVFVISGILIRLGIDKKWFMVQPVPTVVIPSFGFGLIPVGLALCATVLIPLWTPNADIAGNWFCFGATPLLGFGFLLVVWQPRWALPRWYWWLKENYGDILVALRADARRIGPHKWAAMVRTQEGLERWAEEVRQRHRVGGSN